MDIYLLDRARAQLLVQLRRENSLDYRAMSKSECSVLHSLSIDNVLQRNEQRCRIEEKPAAINAGKRMTKVGGRGMTENARESRIYESRGVL